MFNKTNYYLGLILGKWYRIRYWNNHDQLYLWGIYRYVIDFDVDPPSFEIFDSEDNFIKWINEVTGG